MTAQELLEAYIKVLQAERNASPYTLRNYRTDLLSFIRYLDDDTSDPDLGCVDRHALRQYLAQLRQEGVASGSVARKVSTIRSFYRFLAREGYIAGDPIEGVRGPKRERRLPHVLTVRQVVDLITSSLGQGYTGLRDRAIVELLYAAGVRISELVGLDVGNVDLTQVTVRVTGKGNQERISLMGRPAQDALHRYLKTARPVLSHGREERALFLNRDGGRLSARAVQLMVRRKAAAAGLDERVYPHLLRHTFATHLVDGGADIRVVQALLGHKKVDTTQIYTHVTEAQQRRVYLAAFYNQVRPKRRQQLDDENTAD